MSFLAAIVLFIGLIPSMKTSAAVKYADINIISSTKITAEDAAKWAKSKNATDSFINLAKLYWKYYKDCGNVNPAIAYVQSAKETGYGRFGGVINETYNNPCGMKISAGGADSDPDAHMKFKSWDEGVQAQLDHLALYAGASGYPRSNTYDPRHFVTIKGKAKTVNALGGNWAPSKTYGEEVNKLYNDLLSFSGYTPELADDDKQEDDSQSSGNTEAVKPDTSKPESSEAIKPSEDDNKTSSQTSTGWKKIGGYWYYYTSAQTKATGWQKLDNKWYFFDNSGKMSTGWLSYGSWYYLQKDGSMLTGFADINGAKYYLQPSGEMKTGWQTINNKWYYFGSSGAMLTGWIKPYNTWYYMFDNGVMATGLREINGQQYYLDSSGAMRTGWQMLQSKWYYFTGSGAMHKNVWLKYGNSWYYIYDTGVMATGWFNQSGNKYYLKSDGEMATGWTAIGNATYYFDYSSGRMLKDTKIDGWTIDSDGKRGDRDSNSGTRGVIVVDPGHSTPLDEGAISTINGITYNERELNMQVAIKLKYKLQSMGYVVYMTRNEFETETVSALNSLTKRVLLANNNKDVDFFVSIHHNSAVASAHGVETYYSSNTQDASLGGRYDFSRITKSRAMATSINNSFASKTGAYNRGAKDANLFVCRNTNVPSVLVECGFLTNAEEAAKCATSSYQNLEAQAIADAISQGIN